MSVPVYKRSENKLQALKDTLELTAYTIHMCENDKIFPKKCRWTLCTRIIDACLDSIVKIRQANKLRIDNFEEGNKRVALQKDILNNFEALWGLMTVAYETYNVPAEKMDYWTQKMLTTDELVNAWRKSDISRLPKKES